MISNAEVPIPTSVKAKFKVKKEQIDFTIFIGQQKPSDDIGSTGDVYRESQKFYVRSVEGWKEVDPSQRFYHPTIGSVRMLQLEPVMWIAPSTVRSRRKRRKVVDTEESDDGQPKGSPQDNHQTTFSQEVENESTIKSTEPQPWSIALLNQTGLLTEQVTSEPILPGHQCNAWIKELLDVWSAPPLNRMPLATRGSEILHCLLEYPVAIPEHDNTLNITHKSTPALSHVLSDLINLPPEEMVNVDIVDGAHVDVFNGRPVDIIDSIIQGPYIDWHSLPRKPFLTALSIPFKAKGMLSCGLELPQDILTQALPEFREEGRRNKQTVWSSALSPMGMITHIHCDYHGAAQAMLHITGKKLWLFWPPTKANLKWYDYRKYTTVTGNRTLEAIKQMEGMTIRWVTEPIGFFVPPYGFHAVITFTPASHSGTRLWGYQWMVQSFEGLHSDLEWCARSLSYGSSVEQGVSVMKEIEVELRFWDLLLENIPNDQEGPFLQQKVTKVKGKLRETKKILNMQKK